MKKVKIKVYFEWWSDDMEIFAPNDFDIKTIPAFVTEDKFRKIQKDLKEGTYEKICKYKFISRT